MGHKHTREELLAAAIDVAFDVGLSQLSFGRVAKHAGTSDRVIVYYFESKDVLVTEVVVSLGVELQTTLASALDGTITDHVEMLRAAWPVLTTAEADRVFSLFFEANGLATAGREPYATLVPQLVDAWIEWAATSIDGPEEHRRLEAETAIALVDGLVLLRLLRGADAADRAAARLGIC